MEEDEVPSFGSPGEEAAYWKTKAQEWKQAASSAKEELDEFQEGSRELEAELEAQLTHTEIKNKELKALANRLQMENEQIKEKLDQCSREYHYQISELETELSEIKGIKDKLQKYVRELEQQNDDLERAKRSTLASLEDFEARMNAAIERNAFLESELDEKETLKMAVQRLKDETRDLRSELKVLNPQFEEEPDNDRSLGNTLDSNKVAETDEGKQGVTGDGSGASNGAVANSGAGGEPALVNGVSSGVAGSPVRLQNGGGTINGGSPQHTPPLTPSARISALGIVGDLLRKVGALELKLVSCRNIVKENGKDDRNGFASLDRPTKKLPRGASSPAVKNLGNDSGGGGHSS